MRRGPQDGDCVHGSCGRSDARGGLDRGRLLRVDGRCPRELGGVGGNSGCGCRCCGAGRGCTTSQGAVQLHARGRFLVLIQVGLESKGFATARAGKGLDAGVSLHVCAQVGFVGESLPAHAAPEGLLSCNVGCLIEHEKSDRINRLFPRQSNVTRKSSRSREIVTVASPVCVLMCPCSSQGREKHLPQVGHLQPWLWVRMCWLKAGVLTYTLSQYGHLRAARLSSGER